MRSIKACFGRKSLNDDNSNILMLHTRVNHKRVGRLVMEKALATRMSLRACANHKSNIQLFSPPQLSTGSFSYYLIYIIQSYPSSFAASFQRHCSPWHHSLIHSHLE